MKRNSEHILTEWLVTNCQLGNSDALHQLLVIWYPKLLRYAERQVSDPQKAQDAVQNTFEVVTKTITKVNDPASFPKWLYQILHNKCVDLLRQHQRQHKLTNDYHVFTEMMAVTNSSDASTDHDLDDLLLGLDSTLYQLIHLHYLEGFSISEISSVVGIPTGTVKSRLHQARKQLREQSMGEENE